jgi:hypothetical protein
MQAGKDPVSISTLYRSFPYNLTILFPSDKPNQLPLELKIGSGHKLN